MDYKILPRIVTHNDQSASKWEWLHDLSSPQFYMLYKDAVYTGIMALVESHNNRGLTLINYGVSGNGVKFFLSRGSHTFKYSNSSS